MKVSPAESEFSNNIAEDASRPASPRKEQRRERLEAAEATLLEFAFRHKDQNLTSQDYQNNCAMLGKILKFSVPEGGHWTIDVREDDSRIRAVVFNAQRQIVDIYEVECSDKNKPLLDRLHQEELDSIAAAKRDFFAFAREQAGQTLTYQDYQSHREMLYKFCRLQVPENGHWKIQVLDGGAISLKVFDGDRLINEFEFQSPA